MMNSDHTRKTSMTWFTGLIGHVL